MYKQLKANMNRAQVYAGDATDEDIWDKSGDLRLMERRGATSVVMRRRLVSLKASANAVTEELV